MDREQQRKLNQSQGIKLTRPDIIFKPKNRIEEALANRGQGQLNAKDPYLPQINKSLPNTEPLRIIEESTTKSLPKHRPGNPFRIIKPALLLLSLFFIVGLVAYVGYWGVSTIDYNKTSVTQSMIANISKYGQTPLPTDEQPTIVTVSKLEPLQNQPIFRNAKVGDTLLIYTKARRAILYRPTEKEGKAIIEDATLVD